MNSQMRDDVTKRIHDALRASIESIVAEEADKAATEVSKRVNALVAKVALDVAQFYKVEYQERRIVIEVRSP